MLDIMKVSTSWSASYEFACHSAACRPPKSGGTGGSSKGGYGIRVANADDLRRAGASQASIRHAEDLDEKLAAYRERAARKESPEYKRMKAREAAQQRLAHTNKYRVAQGMNPLTA